MRFDDRLLTVLNQPAATATMRRFAGGSWSTLWRAPARTAQARWSLRRWTRSVPRPPMSTNRCAPLRRGPSPLFPFRSGFSNVSRPTGCRCRRRCSPPQLSTLPSGGRCSASPTMRPGGSSRPSIRKVTEPQADLTDSLVEAEPEAGEQAAPAAEKPPLAPSLHEVVERIERRRRNRERRPPDETAAGAAAPLGAPALFRWEWVPAAKSPGSTGLREAR